MNEKTTLAVGLTAASLMLVVVMYALHASIRHSQEEKLQLSSCGREDAQEEHSDDEEGKKSEQDWVQHGRPHVEFTLSHE